MERGHTALLVVKWAASSVEKIVTEFFEDSQKDEKEEFIEVCLEKE